MFYTWLTIFCLVYSILNTTGEHKNKDFEERLENVTECPDPQPPFAKKRTFIIELQVYNLKGINYVGGRIAVLANVPFRNFSSKTYSVDPSGRRELKFHLDKLNCRSLAGQVFLAVGNFNFSKKNCLIMKGTSSFKDLDLNKISHKFPSWHPAGIILHRIQLAYGGDSIFCYELVVTIRNVH